MFSYFLSGNDQTHRTQTLEYHIIDEIIDEERIKTSTPDTIGTLDIVSLDPSESPNFVESHKPPRINKLILENAMLDKIYKYKNLESESKRERERERERESERESESEREIEFKKIILKYMSEIRLINLKFDILAIYCIGLGIFVVFK
jgi:hypothetical protein